MNLRFFRALYREGRVCAIQQILALFKHSQGYPQRFFDFFRLAFKECGKGE